MECAWKHAKLRLDLHRVESETGGMDDDTRHLIDLLCTRIGTAMEDTSIIALGSVARTQEQLEADLEELERATAQVAALTKAARSLLS